MFGTCSIDFQFGNMIDTVRYINKIDIAVS